MGASESLCQGNRSIPTKRCTFCLLQSIVLLYIAPHMRCLPEPYSMDKSALSYLARWHRREAEAMRGLPPRCSHPTISSKAFWPCQTVYHPQCFRAGPPFSTHLANHGGLVFPSTISWWPHLICEACTVRAVLGRELTGSLRDQSLLMLERVRMLDRIHSWSKGTQRTCQTKVKVIRKFERDFTVPVLQATNLQCPPH
jgi:hypothetical protein